VIRDSDHTNGRSSGSSVRGNPGFNAPMTISRMSERSVYDLDRIRANPFNVGATNAELVSRALRAVDLGHYPAHLDPDRVKAHIEGLLRLGDDEDFASSQVARRILVTGQPDYRHAFMKLITSTWNGTTPGSDLSREEKHAVQAVQLVRAMATGVGAQGGFAVPYMIDSTVLPTSSGQVNPLRRVCRVETITGNEFRAVSSGGLTAVYATEGQEATDSAPTLAQPVLTAQRAQAFVPISRELSQDWSSVIDDLGLPLQNAKDDLEADKFTNGTGIGQPQGLITGATTTVTGSGGTGTFVIGDLAKTEEALGPRFRPRAQWFGNRAIYNKARSFDTSGAADVWLPDLRTGIPNNARGNTGYTLVGYGANEVSAMTGTVAAANKILCLGDPQYFLIVDRIGLDVEAIPHTFGPNMRPLGQRGLWAMWRNSSAILSANAFRVLVVP
jgi:HK97 family phage major capsid protein